jgi:hypothetical protein
MKVLKYSTIENNYDIKIQDTSLKNSSWMVKIL